MRFAARLLISAAFLTAGGCLSSPPKTAPPDPTPASAGWRPLFNSRDLSGWAPLGTAHWRVQDDAILGTQDGDPSRAGLLTTREQFKNFELYIDFNIEEHGKYNSGVYLRNEPGSVGQTGYQVNIGRGIVGEYSGGIYRKGWLSKGDLNDVIRRPGTWNTLYIVADGPHIVVELNGVRVADYTETDPDPKLVAPGVIALQTYGREPPRLGQVPQRQGPRVAGIGSTGHRIFHVIRPR